ncbi:MAG: hypothetical protein P0Y60_01270 [Candidatus Microbacterium colombiense]|nr:MAG: hypothetical protein P0Y60_01270 [Microbacterium sp.]
MPAPDDRTVSRRTVIGAVWATPIVAVAVAAPLAAASEVDPVAVTADTSSATRFTLYLTTTQTLPAGVTVDVNIDGTANQWAINSSGSIPASWSQSRSGSRGARLVSGAIVEPGTLTFALGLAGIGSYPGTVVTVTDADGALLATLTIAL